MGRRSGETQIDAGRGVILVDTSVWIDFFAGKKSAQTGLLISSIEDSVDICTCGPVITEVLQGVRSNAEYNRIHTILDDLIFFPAAKSVFVKAAIIYRTIRQNGKTIRSPIDCVIASICLEHEAAILHNDKDFDVIARYFPLKNCIRE